jgi:hypothetical protein
MRAAPLEYDPGRFDKLRRRLALPFGPSRHLRRLPLPQPVVR